jgi:hypothetical protein
VRVSCGALSEELVGKYYVIDPASGVVVERNVDLAGLGLRLFATLPWKHQYLLTVWQNCLRVGERLPAQPSKSKIVENVRR